MKSTSSISPIEVLLPLFLLHFQREARAENALQQSLAALDRSASRVTRVAARTHRRQREEGDGKDGEARCDDASKPRLRYDVTVANRRHRDLQYRSRDCKLDTVISVI